MTAADIRPYQDADLDDLYRVCLRTGYGGADATALYADPRTLGHTVVAQYALFEPSLAFVAEDELCVGGYTVGALDSKTFELRLARQGQSAAAHGRGGHPRPAVSPGIRPSAQRYNGTADGGDTATAMTVSADGRTVFVTGPSEGRADGTASYDYLTVAYQAATGRRPGQHHVPQLTA